MGLTGDTAASEHLWEGLIAGFTRRYGVKLLVWYEGFPAIEEAIGCEKRIKAWRRYWKIKLIEAPRFGIAGIQHHKPRILNPSI